LDVLSVPHLAGRVREPGWGDIKVGKGQKYECRLRYVVWIVGRIYGNLVE
jgi:hypothetical protein